MNKLPDYPVEIPEEFIEHSDGASIPLTLRVFLKHFYPSSVLKKIDYASVYHDYLHDQNPKQLMRNRFKYIHFLFSLEVPYEVIKIVNRGLHIYDISPKFLKKKFFATVTEKQPRLQVLFSVFYKMLIKFYEWRLNSSKF